MSEPASNKVLASDSGAAAAVAEPSAMPQVQDKLGAFDLLVRAVVAMFLTAAALCLWTQNWMGISFVTVGIFLAVAVASELFPVTLADGNSEITLTPILVWGIVALFGPGLGILLAFSAAALGSVVFKLILNKGQANREGFWQYLLYNSCVIGTTTGVGALVYHYLGGAQMAMVSIDDFPLSRIIFPLFAATFVALGMDVIFYAVGSAVAEADQLRESSFDHIWMRAKVLWLKNAFAFLPSYVMFTPFAFVLAYLFVWRGLGFWGVLPILIPFFSLRQALNLLARNIQAYRQTISTLAMLMQKYHPYTRGHLKRVADLSLRLAIELRLPASSQQWIWEAGLLHDIGKVGVPEHILDKTTKLTDEEWEIIKSHPVKSAEILSQMEFLDTIVPWVKYHHERVDGRGYPDGLNEETLPIEAAIIAVADAFDAMTGSKNVGDGKEREKCDACEWMPGAGETMPDECPECGATLIRIYREPMTIDQGIAQLRYGVGTQFSPRVVRAFIRMLAREGLNTDA